MFFLLFYGGVELFCDIVKSVVVVGDIVLVPVLVLVLVSAGMPSSWTWFFPTWRRRKTAWTQSWRMNALALLVMLSRNTGTVFPGTLGILATCLLEGLCRPLWEQPSRLKCAVEELDSQATQALSEVANRVTSC